MRQRVFRFTGLSLLLLLIANAVLWVHSFGNVDYIQWTDTRHFPGLVSSDGRLIWSYQFWENGVGGNKPGWGMGSWKGVYWKTPDNNDPNTWADSRNYLLGFEWSPKAGGVPKNSKFIFIPTPTTFVAAVPHWFICATLALLLWRWFVARGRRRRLTENLCPACGYDLRASPERCPECGKAILPALTAALPTAKSDNP